MNSIKGQVKTLVTNWKTVQETLEPNPQIAAPHLETISIEQINEVVETLENLFSRVNAPQGFSPGFHVAKAVASTSLSTLNTALTSLVQGQYGHFPSFILGLNQAVTALYTCVLRSEIQNSDDQVTHELVEKITLLNTAQTELGKKLESLKAADIIAAKIEEAEGKISTTQKQAEESLTAIDEVKESSQETYDEIKKHEAEYNKLSSDSASALERIEQLELELKQKSKRVEEIEVAALEQQKLITALLPNAASAGLAYAFSSRVRKMEISKNVWLGGFLLAIALLLTLGIITLYETTNATNVNIIALYFRRIPLIAPLIWLGWFSAVQYGNSLRVQEDYAFKEATSKAFEGYRDHMEHLKSIEIDEAESALTLLSKSTIDILSREPLRVFKGAHRDATPANAVHDMMKK